MKKFQTIILLKLILIFYIEKSSQLIIANTEHKNAKI